MMIHIRKAAMKSAEPNWYERCHLFMQVRSCLQIVNSQIVRPEHCYDTLPLCVDVILHYSHKNKNRRSYLMVENIRIRWEIGDETIQCEGDKTDIAFVFLLFYSIIREAAYVPYFLQVDLGQCQTKISPRSFVRNDLYLTKFEKNLQIWLKI